MIKNIYLYIKFYFLKMFSSKYKIKGKCICCGACCKNIVFMINEDYVKDEKQFESLKNFDKKYNHFEIHGKNEKGVMLFKCKSLNENNRCKDYLFRSLYCRTYPLLTDKIRLGGFETLDTCGYSIIPDKKFKDFLK